MAFYALFLATLAASLLLACAFIDDRVAMWLASQITAHLEGRRAYRDRYRAALAELGRAE